MNKSSLMFIVIIILVVIVGFVVYKSKSITTYSNPAPQYIVTPTPVENIDQQALNQELDQIDQMAKSIDDSNDKDSDLNNLSL